MLSTLVRAEQMYATTHSQRSGWAAQAHVPALLVEFAELLVPGRQLAPDGVHLVAQPEVGDQQSVEVRVGPVLEAAVCLPDVDQTPVQHAGLPAAGQWAPAKVLLPVERCL